MGIQLKRGWREMSRMERLLIHSEAGELDRESSRLLRGEPGEGWEGIA